MLDYWINTLNSQYSAGILRSTQERPWALVSTLEHWEVLCQGTMSGNGAMAPSSSPLISAYECSWCHGANAPCSWVLMATYECSWILMNAHEKPWACKNMVPWALMSNDEHSWALLSTHKHSWVLISSLEHSWVLCHGLYSTHEWW